MKQIKLTGNRLPTVRHSGVGAQSGNLAQGTRNHRSASGAKHSCGPRRPKKWAGRGPPGPIASAAYGRSENWCFFYVTLALPARGGHSSNKYCMTVYGSILMTFQRFFQKGLLCQERYMILIYVARWRLNFSEIAVKNYEKSKNRRKSLCAPLRIDS